MHLLSLILLWWAFNFLKWLNMKFNFFSDQWLLIKPQYLKAHRKFQRLQFCFVDINLATFSLFTFSRVTCRSRESWSCRGASRCPQNTRARWRTCGSNPCSDKCSSTRSPSSCVSGGRTSTVQTRSSTASRTSSRSGSGGHEPSKVSLVTGYSKRIVDITRYV